MTAAPEADKLWPEVGIDPIKLALPSGVGYTLRAYRPAGEVTATEAAPPSDDDEDDPFAARERARAAEAAELGDTMVETLHDNEVDAVDAEEPDEADFLAEETTAEQAAAEEVPLFLSHQGRLLVFGTPESLVEFVHGRGDHDLRQLDEWADLSKRIQPSDVAPGDDDTYELDLVVDNLRGGQDAWDLPLLISAGEIARDIGYALRLKPVIEALSPGSPLDDLDETLRAALGGGLGGILARRRLRRVGAQQASLGWRTVIGKMSAAIDWRD